MSNADTKEAAASAFAAASRQIAQQLTGKQGNAAEIRYSEAYQRQVKLGDAPQLKRKYVEAKKYR